MQPARVSIQTDDFDVSRELAALQGGDAGTGAVAIFVGTVRGVDGVNRLEIEHYPGMTEKSVNAMVDAAFARFDIRGARVVHRVGTLAPQEQIVLVAVTASHRRAAFEACEFLMDYLKTQAPFWKKEYSAGGEHWVDAAAQDDAALARWNAEPMGRSAAPKLNR